MRAGSLPPGTADAPPASASAGAQRLDVRVRRDGALTESQDWLADEVPVALIFNGISHAVMLATPLHLEDFALGFGLTEGLLARADELYGVEVLPDPAGVRIEMDVSLQFLYHRYRWFVSFSFPT